LLPKDEFCKKKKKEERKEKEKKEIAPPSATNPTGSVPIPTASSSPSQRKRPEMPLLRG